jgi:release factor glutamine methyltransferase
MSETVQFFIKETIARQENIQHLETLDLELMACSLLDVERSKLLAFPITLNQEIKDEFRSMIRRRIDGEPLAYILGKKGFWSLDLEVNNQVLVPRPETEVLLEDILLNFNQTNLSLLDLGTGSGAIGLSLKKEKKEWDVYCSDISINALEVANKNSLKNNLEVNFVCCDWLNAFKPNSFDLLISNPPYIKSDDIRLKSDGLSHEPLEALVSGATGKEHLFVIATSSKRFLKKGGYLYLEHSPCQANELKLFLKELNFKNISEIFDLNGDKRVIKAQLF